MLEGLRLALGVPVAVLLAPAKMVGAGEMVWDTVKGAAALHWRDGLALHGSMGQLWTSVEGPKFTPLSTMSTLPCATCAPALTTRLGPCSRRGPGAGALSTGVALPVSVRQPAAE